MDFSNEEIKLLEQYQKLSVTLPSIINRLAVEILPPMFFIFLGLYSGKVIWFLAVITIMAFFNIQRVLRQFKNIERLMNISKKVLGNINDQKNITKELR
jgi:hypothetical protein